MWKIFYAWLKKNLVYVIIKKHSKYSLDFNIIVSIYLFILGCKKNWSGFKVLPVSDIFKKLKKSIITNIRNFFVYMKLNDQTE